MAHETRTPADLFTAPVGTIRRLSSDVAVTIGELVDVTPHPSGPACDGPAVVVAASVNAQGVAVVRAVSLADPTFRVVVASSRKVA